MTRTTGILLGLALLVAALVAGGPALAASVVAESQTSTDRPVATVWSTLDSRQRYTLEVDGPAGATFSAAVMETYVGAQGTLSGSADRSSHFQGTAPYRVELVAPQATLRYWHYAAAVAPTGGQDLVVRVVTAGAS